MEVSRAALNSTNRRSEDVDCKKMPIQYLLNRIRGSVALNPNENNISKSATTYWIIVLSSRNRCSTGERSDSVYRWIDELVERRVLRFDKGVPFSTHPYTTNNEFIKIRIEEYVLIDPRFNYELLPTTKRLCISITECFSDQD